MKFKNLLFEKQLNEVLITVESKPYPLKVVFFKGNPNYGKMDNAKMTRKILQTISSITKDIKVFPSNNPTLEIPDADVYIGFSRGTRYLKQCKGKKISIGGITGKEINYIKNKDDNVKSGDISGKSLSAHFELNDSMQKQLIKLILS